MKVAIVGAGKLGMAVTDTLLGGDHAVTIIDTDETLLQKVSSHIDVLTVTANAKEIRALKSIGISTYDFLIATTDNDETNLVVSMYAWSKKNPSVITRVDKQVHVKLLHEVNIDITVSPTEISVFRIIRFISGILREDTDEQALVEEFLRIMRMMRN